MSMIVTDLLQATNKGCYIKGLKKKTPPKAYALGINVGRSAL